MVTRKTSLPYPSSPSHQVNPQPDPVIVSQNNLLVNSANLPPVPRTTHAFPSSDNASFDDRDNPWTDVQSAQHSRSDRPLPDILKPGKGRIAENDTKNSLSDIPPVLKAGNSNQHTPRSSSESQRSKDFWEEDEDDEDEARYKEQAINNSSSQWAHNASLGQNAGKTVPRSAEGEVEVEDSRVKRKPVPSSSPKQPEQNNLQPSAEFSSNNPFRRPSAEDVQYQQALSYDNTNDMTNTWNQEDIRYKSKGKEAVRNFPTHLPSSETISKTTTGDGRSPNSSIYDESNSEFKAWRGKQRDNDDSINFLPPQGPPPPIPQTISSPFNEQPPLIPLSTESQHDTNPWSSQTAFTSKPSPIPFNPSKKQVSQYNEDLLDRGQETGVIKLGEELNSLPEREGNPTHVHSQSSLLDDDDMGPALPPRKDISRTSTDNLEMFDAPEEPPPEKPPRPNIVIKPPSDADVAKMVEQRNETYQIKHFNWFDHGSGRLRRSSMLVQNENGPCPLLAIVNALILGAKDASQATLDDALRAREQVSLGLIIETLMDEFLSRGYNTDAESLPDVDELNGFLMRLRTGMNANPRFITSPDQAPNIMDARNSMLHLPQSQRAKYKTGTFEATPDMKLYGAFSVPLMHGWLPEPESNAAQAFARSAQTYEDAMALQFGEEELEYKLTRNGLSPEEQQMWEDIMSIKDFLKQYPTQLTPYGLESVQESLSSGSFAIMFRNDHFSTLYKHPESGQLFTLITDAGYADRDEVIWESLVDISGMHTEFFSGDFMPVSHNIPPPSTSSDGGRVERQVSLQQNLNVDSAAAAQLSPQEQQERHDADFAMALQMQEEEEQRQRAEQSRRRSGANRPSSGNIPIPLRSSQQQQQEARPMIPPRNSRSQNPGVNRPSDANDEDAPPAYEIAAKGKPYIPPLGSPLHPSAEPSPMSSNTQLAGTISNTSNSGPSQSSGSQPMGQPPGPNAGIGRRHPTRRTSAYSENTQSYHHSQPQPQHSGPNPLDRRTSHGFNPMQHPSGYPGSGNPMNRPGKVPAQERDCIVM